MALKFYEFQEFRKHSKTCQKSNIFDVEGNEAYESLENLRFSMQQKSKIFACFDSCSKPYGFESFLNREITDLAGHKHFVFIGCGF